MKSAADLAKTLMDLVGSGKAREQAVKLYGEILSAQSSALAANSAQAALIEEKRELEERIRRLEAWEIDKQRYELVEISRGVFARQLKADAKGSEPIHRICATCYEAGRKSILQSDGLPGPYGGTETLKCFQCSAEIGILHQGHTPRSHLGYEDSNY